MHMDENRSKCGDEISLQEEIKNRSALYYYRATPFTEHGEFNYNGLLTEEFFFDHMFSPKGRCNEYLREISESLRAHEHKSIVLIGTQGCGKTTFVHHLARAINYVDFHFFDFDKDTSNSTLSEYVEKFSTHLLELFESDPKVNSAFYHLYVYNKTLILKKMDGANKVSDFFEDFKKAYLTRFTADTKKKRHNLKHVVNNMFFNQILSLTILWYMCKFKLDAEEGKRIRQKAFCLDNLDVLVNKEIVERFFQEYLLFVRNVDAVLQNINDPFFNENGHSYNTFFVFIFSCRQHTWARVKEHYRHSNSFINVSTFDKDLTDAFDKAAIISKREEYICKSDTFTNEFKKDVQNTKSLLTDMEETGKHNIYDLFDDDYRQCNITFEQLVKENPTLIEEYFHVKNQLKWMPLYGARGIVYKALFEKFKQSNIFTKIGVLEIDANKPLVSNARMILNYIDHYTFKNGKVVETPIAFEKIVSAFQGIISESDIERALIAMFRLGDDSPWNELVAFNEIHSDEVTSCQGLEVFITKAGHTYLSLIATHFEFFNVRCTGTRTFSEALFSKASSKKGVDPQYQYNFQETIGSVLRVVERCCRRMTTYYNQYMAPNFTSIEEYLKSPFVYGGANVLHGERIIHTHIRYIDQYRLYLLNGNAPETEKTDINKHLIHYISDYIQIGENNPVILTSRSKRSLFPTFKRKIQLIVDSGYTDCTTAINIDKR